MIIKAEIKENRGMLADKVSSNEDSELAYMLAHYGIVDPSLKVIVSSFFYRGYRSGIRYCSESMEKA